MAHQVRNYKPITPVFLGLLFCAMLFGPMLRAQGQTYSVLYGFSNARGNVGYGPIAGVTVDRAGNLYGTTFRGGFGTGCYQDGCGVVYRLAHRGGGWIYTPLYQFRGVSDGSGPFARPVIGPDGSLYGTTFLGGIGCSGGCGVVFNLSPPARPSPTPLTSWTETVLHLFAGVNDGSNPGSGDLIFDASGNIYGTTSEGGGGFCPGLGCGTVFELARSGQRWTESILHAFNQSNDGNEPLGGVVFDASGDLFGMTSGGGVHNRGTVYKLSPSGSGWAESLIVSFDGATNGSSPYATPIFDAAGNIYGTTCCSGPGGAGTAFQLVSGSWTLNTIHVFSGQMEQGPQSGLIMDAAGNLYGTTNQAGAFGYGAVFKLSFSGGGWTYESLHDFCVGGLPCSDGANPSGMLAFDGSGNIYGTATTGGPFGGGVIFKIEP